MPAVAPLEDLEEVQNALDSFKSKYTEAYAEFSEFFKKYRKVGYKNIIKLMLGEATPKKLKGLE